MQLIASLQRLTKRQTPIRSMQVKNIHALRLQLLQTLLELLPHVLGLMVARFRRIQLRGQHQPTLLPAGLGSEGFLLPTDVGARCVDFVVAGALQVVEALVEFVEGGDARAGFGVPAEGHEAEDYAGFGLGGYERHLGWVSAGRGW
jgi:hypothetical protein